MYAYEEICEISFNAHYFTCISSNIAITSGPMGLYKTI